jgi:hypothetical protein
MKNQRALIALTITNLALLLFTLIQQIRPAYAEGAVPMLRGSGLEIVDGRGNTNDTYVILQSKGEVSSLKLRSEGGHEQVLKP